MKKESICSPVNRFNLDYEFELFDFHKDNKKEKNKISEIAKEFEYVYFFIEKSETILKNLRSYPEDYLDYLKKIGLKVPQFTNNSTIIANNWWGALANKNLEKELNSKETSTNFALEFKYCHSATGLVRSKEELFEHLENHSYLQWIARSAYSSGGYGIFKFKKDGLFLNRYFENKIESFLSKGPMVLEPKLDRILDIGITLNLEKKLSYFFTQNFVSELGSFKGGLIFRNSDLLNSVFFNNQKMMNSYEKFLKKLKEFYINKGAVNTLQIDSFLYKENDEIKCYPLVEVNYRKTMGLVLKNFESFLPEKGIGGWYLFNKKEFVLLKNFGELLKKINKNLYNQSTKCGIIPTSPVSYKFPSLFISAKNKKELLDYLSFVQKTLLNKNSDLPKEFLY